MANNQKSKLPIGPEEYIITEQKPPETRANTGLGGSDQRAAFEAWALDYNSDFDGFSNVLFTKNGKGKYAIIRVQDAWEAWQAALQSSEVQALREALDNLLKVHEGVGGTKFPADEIARAALAAMEKQK